MIQTGANKAQFKRKQGGKKKEFERERRESQESRESNDLVGSNPQPNVFGMSYMAPPPASSAYPTPFSGFGASVPAYPMATPMIPQCAPRGYVPPQSKKVKEVDEHLDTNIISVDLGFLQQAVDVRIGEAYHCSYCHSVLSHIDQLNTIDGNKKQWKCRYCSTENVIENILDEEIPDKPILDYIIEIPQQKEQPSNNIIVYCIDTSGSMSINVNAFDRGKYLTRLDIVKRAIIQQVTNIKRTTPTQKICLIEFNRVVTVHGDCRNTPIIIKDKLLNDYDALVEIAKEKVELEEISKTYNQIVKRIQDMEEQGSTALGPALLVSTIIAEKIRGSQVMLCTDGISNVGLGNCEDFPQESITFYDQLGTTASEKGVVINITTLQGCDANLKTICSSSTKTLGDVLIVDPNDLADVFIDNLNDQLIATDVVINIFLHPAICIKGNEISENPSRKQVTFGNAKTDSKYQFGYALRSAEDIEQFGQLRDFPIQVQIEYKKLDGMKGIRVISQIVEIADEEEEIVTNGNVVQPFYLREAANMRQEGRRMESANAMRQFRTAQMQTHVADQELFTNYADEMDELMEDRSDYATAMFTGAQQMSSAKARKYRKFSKK